MSEHKEPALVEAGELACDAFHALVGVLYEHATSATADRATAQTLGLMFAAHLFTEYPELMPAVVAYLDDAGPSEVGPASRANLSRGRRFVKLASEGVDFELAWTRVLTEEVPGV